jgi:4-hydroxy-2-oxoheptanedioate aldolase
VAALKARLAAGEQLLGVLLRMPAEELVEMVAVSGFDFVVLDCEHGPADVTALRQHIAVAALHGAAVLVRVGSHEPALVLRALDQGATGIVAPHVDTRADAEALVAACHYPPIGHRGFATYSRAGRFGLTAPGDHKQRLREETLVIGMIESPAGVVAAREILTVPGLDGTMIGTADLRASSTAADPEPGSSVRAVHHVVADLGAVRMDIVTDAEHAARSLAEGAQLVVYNLAHTIMAHLAALHGVGRPTDEGIQGL